MAIIAPEMRTNGQRPPRPVEPAKRRRTRRRLGERLTMNVVVGLVAALLAFVLTATLLRDRREMVTVAIAREAIPAGVAITPAMVESSSLPANSSFVDGLVRYDKVVAGDLVAARTLQPGEPLTLAAVGTPTGTTGQRVMSIPLASWQAANGDIQVGDQIDVIETGKDGAHYVLTAAPVVGRANSDGSGGLVGGVRRGDLVFSVEVDATQALNLASAIESGNITVVRATGAPPAEVAAVSTTQVAG